MSDKMTKAEALTEAQRRWGFGALVSEEPWPDGRVDFVLTVQSGIHFKTMGIGKSWEEAFANAVSPSGATHE